MIVVLPQCPYWEDVSVGRVTDHTVLVEHTHYFLQKFNKVKMTVHSITEQHVVSVVSYYRFLPAVENPRSPFVSLSAPLLPGAAAVRLFLPS